MRWRLRSSQLEVRRREDMGRCFRLRHGRHAFWSNLPGIHPFEVIAAVAYANAGPENCHLSSRAMNDRNPKLPG